MNCCYQTAWAMGRRIGGRTTKVGGVLHNRVMWKVWGGDVKTQREGKRQMRWLVGKAQKRSPAHRLSGRRKHIRLVALITCSLRLSSPNTILGHTCLLHAGTHTPSKSSISIEFDYTPSLLRYVRQDGWRQIHESVVFHLIRTAEGGEGSGTKSQRWRGKGVKTEVWTTDRSSRQKMIPKYWRHNKILTTPQGKASGGMCSREIIVAGEVLGVSGCLDSAAGGVTVKLVNPVERGISSSWGARRSRGAVGVCPCEQCPAVTAPHTPMPYPFENPPQALSDPMWWNVSTK